jgi:hypothetical protein
MSSLGLVDAPLYCGVWMKVMEKLDRKRYKETKIRRKRKG